MDLDMDMQHGYGHGHAAWIWTWTCSMYMDMDMQHGYGHGHGHAGQIGSCSMDLDNGHAWMPECMLSPASLVFLSLQRLVRHRHSAIMVSPVPPVTDYSVSAQLCVSV
jgi:hypothetical protein